METTRMSSRGQVVIPRDIRAMVHADEGTLFSVMSMDDTIILKKVEAPSKGELIRVLNAFAREQTKKLKARGFKEEDLWKAVEKLRARHRPKV